MKNNLLPTVLMLLLALSHLMAQSPGKLPSDVKTQIRENLQAEKNAIGEFTADIDAIVKSEEEKFMAAAKSDKTGTYAEMEKDMKALEHLPASELPKALQSFTKKYKPFLEATKAKANINAAQLNAAVNAKVQSFQNSPATATAMVQGPLGTVNAVDPASLPDAANYTTMTFTDNFDYLETEVEIDHGRWQANAGRNKFEIDLSITQEPDAVHGHAKIETLEAAARRHGYALTHIGKRIVIPNGVSEIEVSYEYSYDGRLCVDQNNPFALAYAIGYAEAGAVAGGKVFAGMYGRDHNYAYSITQERWYRVDTDELMSTYIYDGYNWADGEIREFNQTTPLTFTQTYPIEMDHTESSREFAVFVTGVAEVNSKGWLCYSKSTLDLYLHKITVRFRNPS